MKLIILYHYSDGYTYWGTDTIPVERESVEALLCELEDWAKVHPHSKWNNTGIDANTILDKNEYCHYEILTLDDWFVQNCVNTP